MINFASFSDELTKIAAGGDEYRKVTPWEQWMQPEGLIGQTIPLDPEAREEAYRKATGYNIPLAALAGGVFGGLHGYGAHIPGSPVGAAIGTGIGALALGGTSALVRHIMANKVRERAVLEATQRGQSVPQTE